MTGETNLSTLLASMQPELLAEDYAFCTLPQGRYGDFQELAPIASFREAEGLTLVVTKACADGAELEYQGLFRCISLTVHSSLEAVGLTAAISSKLAENGISANVIAAYYHDHVFVPADQASAAMDALAEFSHAP